MNRIWAGGWRQRFSKMVPYLLLLVFWGVGLWRIGAPSFWYDEIINADFVLGHSFGELIQVLRTEQPYPPLYILLLKGWSILLGAQPYAPGVELGNGLETLLRWPSVAAFVLSLAVLTALGRRLCLRGTNVALLLLASHPVFLWYARDARSYAGLIFWLLLALLGLLGRRRSLWVVGGTAALLTHYFALFPLVGAMVGGMLFQRPRYRWREFLYPFVLPAIWAFLAFRVTFGFQNFAPGGPPSIPVFLQELGPNLLSGRFFMISLGRALDPEWGYGLLFLGAVGLGLLTLRNPARGGIVACSWGLGIVGIFIFWQLRPVYHVRYLSWALPFVVLGIVAVPAVFFSWSRGAFLGSVLLSILAVTGTWWGMENSSAFMETDRTLWYPDFRETVAFLNNQAREGDVGVTAAGHAMRVFTAYRSVIPFEAGPQIGERLEPATGLQYLETHRQSSDERRWLFLYQDDAVDPSGILVGTLEAAGGYRTEMWYNRQVRLFAYALPEGAVLRPLAAEQDLKTVFEGGIELEGFSIHREGDQLVVILFWEFLEPQTRDLYGTIHLVRQAGERPLIQRDKPVLNTYWPSSRLPAGEVLADRYEMVLPADLAAGTYQLFCALYDPQTVERLPLVGGGDMVELTNITIQEHP